MSRIGYRTILGNAYCACAKHFLILGCYYRSLIQFDFKKRGGVGCRMIKCGITDVNCFKCSQLHALIAAHAHAIEYCTNIVFCFSLIVNCANPDALLKDRSLTSIKGPTDMFRCACAAGSF